MEVVDFAKLLTIDSNQVHPVILSGGAGATLWPLSRSTFPKQLLPLVSEHTLLQDAAARTSNDAMFTAPIVICNEDHRFLVDEQLREIGVSPQCILTEPVARNSAPAIAVVALWLMEREPGALMLVQPSDNVIAPSDEFYRAVATGIRAARQGNIVIFGVKPTRPDVHCGYIQVGPRLRDFPDAYALEQFIEKPNLEKAKSLVNNGAFYWNSGIILTEVRVIVDELRRMYPKMLESCAKALREGKEDNTFTHLDRQAFGESPFLSIDRAVLEHTENIVVLPTNMTWTDIGSWSSVRDVSPQDDLGNVVRGDVLLDHVTNSFIQTDGRLVAAMGLDDMVVVVTDDAVLVAKSGSTSNVPKIVEQLSRRNRPEPKEHLTVYRPWGHYRRVDMGERFQVKRITVKPGGKLSLQKHFHRAEHWTVVQGTARIQRGPDSMILSENESVYIPIGVEHQLENPGKVFLHLIEVQSGSYLGEDDIVRISDDYGRA
jgi:mannose-1-phosphate guanylyltransferase/mannose-6-phosphate isomerase